MINFKSLSYRDHRNHIKTCIALPVVYLNIFVSGIYYIPDLSGGYSFFGCFKSICRSGFHFHYHQPSILFGHYIKFKFAENPFHMLYRIAFGTQIFLCFEFSEVSKLIVFGHDLKYFYVMWQIYKFSLKILSFKEIILLLC